MPRRIGADEDAAGDEAADRQTELEGLQATAADAEARALTARSELTAARRQIAALEGQVAQATAERESAHEESGRLQAQLDEARVAVRDAAARYRAARLRGAPEVPAELVPESEDLGAIDRDFEAARRVVGELRQRLEEEALERARAFRLPEAGRARGHPETATLSATEKIKLGLEQAAQREGG